MAKLYGSNKKKNRSSSRCTRAVVLPRLDQILHTLNYATAFPKVVTGPLSLQG